jgi:hypothetical protein
MKIGSICAHARAAMLLALLLSPLSPAALGCSADVVTVVGAAGGGSGTGDSGNGSGSGGELAIPQSCVDACGAFAHCLAAGAADCARRCASSRTPACASLHDEALRCLLEESEPGTCKLAGSLLCSVVHDWERCAGFRMGRNACKPLGSCRCEETTNLGDVFVNDCGLDGDRCECSLDGEPFAECDNTGQSCSSSTCCGLLGVMVGVPGGA